jgi:ribosomal-protein-alanine N-acetyltransferase
MKIESDRFVIRELQLCDVTEKYLGWFEDSLTKQYVSAAREPQSLEQLADFVRERLNRSDVAFMGIFDKISSAHIGNIKFEPINNVEKYAVVGVLIGDPEWRGKGTASEALAACLSLLNGTRAITEFVLGVDLANIAAIKAYQKAGFKLEQTRRLPESADGFGTMVCRMSKA